MPDHDYQDYVITPGGFRPRSLVYHVEPGHSLDGSDNRIRKFDPAGKLVQDFGEFVLRPGNEPLMPRNVVAVNPRRAKPDDVQAVAGGAAAAPAPIPALGTGWITFVFWNNATGKPITSFTSSWRVPPHPYTQNGQLIYIFNGIQSATMIYQPVLQWGNNGAFGGNYWCVASWYADGQGGAAFHSSPTTVNVNDLLIGIMSETGKSGSNFNYTCFFQGIPNSVLNITNQPELTWAAETLEAYNLTTCTDYPAAGRVKMSAIEIVATDGHPSLNWTPQNAITDCGQHTIDVSNASPGGEVDLYFNNKTDYIVDKSIIFHDTSPKTPPMHPSMAGSTSRGKAMATTTLT
jgi:hypothetical protein